MVQASCYKKECRSKQHFTFTILLLIATIRRQQYVQIEQLHCIDWPVVHCWSKDEKTLNVLTLIVMEMAHFQSSHNGSDSRTWNIRIWGRLIQALTFKYSRHNTSDIFSILLRTLFITTAAVIIANCFSPTYLRYLLAYIHPQLNYKLSDEPLSIAPLSTPLIMLWWLQVVACRIPWCNSNGNFRALLPLSHFLYWRDQIHWLWIEGCWLPTKVNH